MRKALRLKPDYADAHNNSGIALKAQGRMEEAIASYREAIRLKPNYPERTATWETSSGSRGRWQRR